MKSKKAKKLIREYYLWWTKWLGLRYCECNLIFSKDPGDFNYYNDGSRSLMHCDADWRYQRFTISVNLPEATKLTECKLENAIVHELMHVFLNEMREPGLDHEERVATMLQSAFMWVRDGIKQTPDGDGVS